MKAVDELYLMLLERKEAFQECYPQHPCITSDVLNWMVKAYNFGIETAAQNTNIIYYGDPSYYAEVNKEEILKLKI